VVSRPRAYQQQGARSPPSGFPREHGAGVCGIIRYAPAQIANNHHLHLHYLLARGGWCVLTAASHEVPGCPQGPGGLTGMENRMSSASPPRGGILPLGEW
jgi:hypothetical protein